MVRKILIVGANPSSKSITNKAFDPSTKSGKMLQEWLGDLPMHVDIQLANVYNSSTPNNRPLNRAEIEVGKLELAERMKYLSADGYIALGQVAADVLTEMGLEFYEMPHPSGLNRKLNDKAWAEEKIKGLREFISAVPSLITEDVD